MKNKKEQPFKIGFVLDDSLDSNDGVQQYVRTLGSWLAKQGHTVHYLVGQSSTDGITIHSLSRNIAVRFNKNRLSIPLPANRSAIKSLLAREHYDVLHVQMPFSPLLAGRVIAAAEKQTAVVATFHILPFGRLQAAGSKALALVQKRSFARLDALCSVSPAAKRFARSHFGLDSSVIPNMIGISAWKTPLEPHPGRIVFLGRLVPRKGCKQLLEAYRALPEPVRQKTELFVAGDGPERARLEAYVKKHSLHVHFLGFIDEKHKPSLLASADVAVFPSLGGESFGIVLIEAMAAGAGVVLGGDNPGYASVMEAEHLINPKHTTAFSQHLERALTNEDFRRKAHQKQQRNIKQYDTAVAGKQIVAMYTQALLHRRKNVT